MEQRGDRRPFRTILIVAAASAVLAGCGGPKRVVRTPRDVLEAEAARRRPPPAAPASEAPPPASRPTSPATSTARPPAASRPSARSSEDALLGLEAASIARDQVGVPYVWGGDSPDGFDCSGLVQYVYGRAGLDLPRTVRELSRQGREVPPHEASPGDLLFFRIDHARVSHVGIFLGGRLFVHAPGKGDVVREDRLDDPYWLSRLDCVRRLP